MKKISLLEKVASIASIGALLTALAMLRIVEPTYETPTSLIFNNGFVLLFLLVGTYLAYGRSVRAFTKHSNLVYIFSRVFAPSAAVLFFAENIALRPGFLVFFSNLAGIGFCLLVLVTGALEEIAIHSRRKETPSSTPVPPKQVMKEKVPQPTVDPASDLPPETHKHRKEMLH